MEGIRHFPHRQRLARARLMAAGIALIIIGLLTGYSNVAANSINDYVRTAMVGNFSSSASCCASAGRPFN